MIDLDFVEIGTSNFKTLIEHANDETKGISVEPIKYYLDQLPNKSNVKKINCAIAADNREKEVEVFYIPEKTIIENKLPWYLKGCNCIGKYHRDHISQSLKKYVVREKIKQIPISTLFIENQIRSVKNFKIDTEGSDCDILSHFEKYLRQHSNEFYPDRITFETNSLTSKKSIAYIIDLYKNLGYIVETINKADTTLKKVKL